MFSVFVTLGYAELQECLCNWKVEHVKIVQAKLKKSQYVYCALTLCFGW